jgi:hypothetical protein
MRRQRHICKDTSGVGLTYTSNNTALTVTRLDTFAPVWRDPEHARNDLRDTHGLHASLRGLAMVVL